MSQYHALIIDDQTPNIDVLAMLLAQEGVSYTPATTVRQIADVVAGMPQLDMVFLDLEMPNSDYHDTLATMKADVNLAGVPIIAYTVHTSEIDAARQAGFDGFLGKPLKTVEFAENLRTILKGECVWTY
jgi:two-component system cell cycle response regulator DivK